MVRESQTEEEMLLDQFTDLLHANNAELRGETNKNKATDDSETLIDLTEK